MAALFDIVYIIIIMGIISLQYIRFKKREFKGPVGDMLCLIKQQNLLAIIFFIAYYTLILILFSTITKYKSVWIILFFVIIIISSVFSYSKRFFISTLGVGSAAPFKRTYDFNEWEKIKDWYIEKNNNKNGYTFGVRLNENGKIIMWEVNEQEKEKIQKIFMEFKKDKGILL